MSAVDVVRRRLSGSYVVDETGLDEDVARLAGAVLGIGWRVRVEGAERLPTGAALVVHNRLVGLPETFAVARGISVSTGRRARFLGVPDIDVVGPALRKLGGASSHPAEAAALLRDGHLVCVGGRRSLRPRPWSAVVPPSLLAVANDLDVPLVPVAVAGGVVPGSWRVTVS